MSVEAGPLDEGDYIVTVDISLCDVMSIELGQDPIICYDTWSLLARFRHTLTTAEGAESEIKSETMCA